MRIIIVGNAKQPWEGEYDRINDWRPVSKFINQSDIVVRFNRMRNQYKWWSGRKNSILYSHLNGSPGYKNSVKRIPHIGVKKPDKNRTLFDDYDYNIPPYLKNDQKIPVDYSRRIIRRNNWNSNNVSRLDHSISEQCREILFCASEQRLAPTLGFVAFVDLLNDPKFTNYQKYYAGFTFEGYSGHNWELEKSIVQNWTSQGKLIVLSRDVAKKINNVTSIY